MIGIILTIFAGAFWLFRVIVCLMNSIGTSIPFVPLNTTIEIILLFVTFVCIILMAKRRMFGVVIYLISQAAYFGVDGYKNLAVIMEGTPSNGNYISVMIALVAIAIPIFSIMDIGLDSGKGGSAHNRKTSWFYDNEAYDRKYDEGADKNQYKF